MTNQSKSDNSLLIMEILVGVIVILFAMGLALSFKKLSNDSVKLSNEVSNMVNLYSIAEKQGTPLNMYLEFSPNLDDCLSLKFTELQYEIKTPMQGKHYLPYSNNNDVVSIPATGFVGFNMRVSGLDALLPYVSKVNVQGRERYYIALCVDPHTHTTYVSKINNGKDIFIAKLKSKIDLLVKNSNDDVCVHIGIMPHSITSLPVFNKIEQ